MHFEFPIDHFRVGISKHGSAEVKLIFNGKLIDGFEVNGSDLEQSNEVELKFTKKDPGDQDSYATIDKIELNGFDFTDDFKTIPYVIDRSMHTHSESEIPNNLYFGYIGSLKFRLTQKNDPLTKAAWILANKEFEYVKLPLKGDNYREKNLHNILRDTKFMFTGSLAPNTKNIIDSINSLQLNDLRLPLKPNDRKSIEQWINRSSRINFSNFNSMKHFTYTNGIVDCLNSFISNTKTLYLPTKIYYFYREILQDKDVIIKDLFTDDIEENSKVIFELPSPWYTTKDIKNKIKEARLKNCTIALDLTWMPVSNDLIELDLSEVDQIFFSMNKTWPIQDFRPAFRWSQTHINDAATFQWEHCTYPKISANVFMNLMKSYKLDYVYDKYKPIAERLMTMFDLRPTSVLWFTLHDHVKHDPKKHIWPGYFLDDFVCLRKLLDYQGKYFW